jgi:hypothetical protein
MKKKKKKTRVRVKGLTLKLELTAHQCLPLERPLVVPSVLVRSRLALAVCIHLGPSAMSTKEDHPVIRLT